MGWRITIVLMAVLALGLSRLAFESRPNTGIGIDLAYSIATCLGPAKDVAPNTSVTLLPLPEGANNLASLISRLMRLTLSLPAPWTWSSPTPTPLPRLRRETRTPRQRTNP